MGHTYQCPNCGPMDESTENRPSFCATVTKTASQVFAGNADCDIGFDPVEFKIVVGLNPIEWSYDGYHVHGSLDAGRSETFAWTLRRKFWFRERSDATGGVATTAILIAAANSNKPGGGRK